MKWQRPTRLATKCRVCGDETTIEYIRTYQHAPSDNAPWVPLCDACLKTPKAETAVNASLAWSGFASGVWK